MPYQSIAPQDGKCQPHHAYKGFKNLELTAGIKNIFDEDPSASNVLDNFQYGYDPRYGDPTGRTYYLRGTYKF
ncbi:hypothetical protein [Acinetobacter seifertii]|uniref:hypothetical protein n=1 Tax=Acinetobacter seifertii TaxID=1530123 RepID=UPI003412997D